MRGRTADTGLSGKRSMHRSISRTTTLERAERPGRRGCRAAWPQAVTPAARHPGEEADFRAQLAAEHDRHRWCAATMDARMDRVCAPQLVHPPGFPDLVRPRCRNRPPSQPARAAPRQITPVEHGACSGQAGIGHETADARNRPAADAGLRASVRHRRHATRRKPSRLDRPLPPLALPPAASIVVWQRGPTSQRGTPHGQR